MAAAAIHAGGMPVQLQPAKTCSDRTKLVGMLAFAVIAALGPVLHHFGMICSTSAITVGAAGGTAFLATLLLLALESRKPGSPIKEDAPELFKALFQGPKAVKDLKGKADELHEGRSAIEVAAANGLVEELNILLETSEEAHCQKAFFDRCNLASKRSGFGSSCL